MVKRVRNAAIKLLITGGVIIGVIYVAKRFGIGGQITEGFGALGSTLTDAPLALIKSIAEGSGQIGAETIKISENFQRALGGGLLGSEQKLFGGGGFVGGTINESTILTRPGESLPDFLRNALNVFGSNNSFGNDPSRASSKLGSSVFDIRRAFDTFTQQRRLEGFQESSGFNSAIEQETALQLAIAESRAKFGEFFKGA